MCNHIEMVVVVVALFTLMRVILTQKTSFLFFSPDFLMGPSCCKSNLWITHLGFVLCFAVLLEKENENHLKLREPPVAFPFHIYFGILCTSIRMSSLATLLYLFKSCVNVHVLRTLFIKHKWHYLEYIIMLISWQKIKANFFCCTYSQNQQASFSFPFSFHEGWTGWHELNASAVSRSKSLWWWWNGHPIPPSVLARDGWR